MKEDLIQKIHSTQNNSERSNQREIGASELGDCRRKVWYRINGQERTNPNTLSLAAFMGTAIHEKIESMFSNDIDCMTEVEVASRGMKGHIDHLKEGKITDWKTITKKNVSYLGSKQQWWQQDTYALMANDNGFPVHTVQLVGIPRDGNENDIVVLTKPYDEANALEALDWLADVRKHVEPPAPEKDALFCADYCPFFGACPGRTSADDIDFLIDDFDINSAARDYLELGNKIKEMEIKRDGAKQILEGVRGTTPDGISVAWSLVAGRRTIDEQAVLAHMGEVPKKQGEPSMRLAVK